MVINDFWEFVINGFNDVTDPAQYAILTSPRNTQLKESRRKYAKTLSLIEATMTKTIFSKIAAPNYEKESWDILEKNFKGTDKVRVVKLQMIKRDLKTFK